MPGDRSVTRDDGVNSRGASGARRTKETLVAGRIVRPHGVKGALVLEAASDLMSQVRPGQAVFVGDASRTEHVVSLQPHSGRYLLYLKGISSREAAEELRGLQLLLNAQDLEPLPEGVYYRWEIVGLRVLVDDGSELGTVAEVLSTGANDVYEVERADGKRVLLPAITSVIRQIDLDAGVLRVQLPPGLIDEG